MATSDYGFPFTLSKIGYNRNHISSLLVLSDVAPHQMLKLLLSWGVRSNLAYLLVEIYGGHILQMSRCLFKLQRKKQSFRINSSFISGLSSQLALCIAESKIKNIEKEVNAALETLMSTGFFPCNIQSPVAELLTICNVAGFVDTDADVPGLKYSFVDQLPGLVPSTQMIRIVYAIDCFKNQKDKALNLSSEEKLD
jgi:hypothetical protein